MGIIQKTREKSALMFIVLGGALLAFILTEYLSSNFSNNELDTTVGAFNGIEISDQEFSAEREKLVFLMNGGESFSATRQKGRFTNEAWNSILRDKFYKNEAEELGIKVTSDEEQEMLIGGNDISKNPPFAFYVNYLFGGSEMYEKNRDNIAKNTSDLSDYAYMAVFDQQRRNIVQQIPLKGSSLWVRDFGIKLKEQEKLQRILSNCFYTTTSLAKDEFLAKNSKKDIELGFVKYSQINDESIEPTEEEIKSAYEEIKHQFIEKENSRKLIFATFNLQPSDKDRQTVLQDIASLKTTLNEEINPKLFIKNETDANEIVDFTFYKRGEYPQKIAGIDTVLYRLKKGDTYGPFTNTNQSKFGIAKILDVKQLADSAKVEMAFVNSEPVIKQITKGDPEYEFTAEDKQKFRELYVKLSDSLLEEAQSKKLSSFSKDFVSIDSTYIKNGKLEWAQLSKNTYGRNFMDTIISCEVGDVKKVFIPTGQGGGIYGIIKVKKFGIKSRKMQIGTIIKNVLPGDETQEDYMARANQVAFIIKEGKDLISFADSLDYVVDSADVKGSTYSLKGIPDSRQIIYWTFNTDLNEPSNVFITPNAFVVGVVRSENSSKYRSLDDPYVKTACEAHARKEKQKAKILSDFPELNAKNLQSLAQTNNAIKVIKETAVNLKSGSSEFSNEFEVIGNIAGLTKDKTSDLIKGEEGIYIVKIVKEHDAEITENTNFDLEKNQLQYTAQRNGNLLVDEYINDKSDLTDNRKILR